MRPRTYIANPRRTERQNMRQARCYALKCAMQARMHAENTMGQLFPSDPLYPVVGYHVAMWTKFMEELAK